MKIPEYKIELVPVSENAKEARGFKWAGPEVGNRSKVGGAPDFLQQGQNPVCPVCPSCSFEMTFVAQIDSIGDEICIADVGMVYTFVCFDCFEATSFVESG